MVGKNLLKAFIAEPCQALSPSSSELNLLDEKKTFEYLERERPQAIIHCAGRVGGIQANINAPVQFLTENWEMGKNLVLGAKAAGVKNLLNLGSSCMYPKNIEGLISEEMLLNGPLEPTNEGYSIAKISVAKLCEYIVQEDSDYKYRTLIPCNLYGHFDNFSLTRSHMIPGVIRRMHEATVSGDESIEVWGDGTARREFMFVGDLVEFIKRVIPNISELPQYLNVGLGYDYSINEYYEAISKAVGFSGQFQHDLSKPVGMKRKVVNVDKLKKLGWKAETSLEDGIKLTYEFFKKEVLSE